MKVKKQYNNPFDLGLSFDKQMLHKRRDSAPRRWGITYRRCVNQQLLRVLANIHYRDLM